MKRNKPGGKGQAPTKFLAQMQAGIEHFGRGRIAEALACFQAAIALNPTSSEAQANAGATLCNLGRNAEAEAPLRRALELNPNSVTAGKALGLVLRALGRHDEALPLLEKAVSREPGDVSLLKSLGAIKFERGRFEEALAWYEKARALRPDDPDIRGDLGAIQRKLYRLAEADDNIRWALERLPQAANLYANRGSVLRMLGRYDEAIESYRQAVAVEPGNSDARWNLSIVLLLTGQFAEGWQQYEYRWGVEPFPSAKRRFTAPRWKGEPIAGKRILVHQEQGLGDSLQFVRYLKLLRELGAHVIFECQPSLCPLLEGSPWIDELVADGTPLPHHDCFIPLISIPGLLGTDLSSIPAAVPYLAASPERVAQWRERCAGPGLKVGLVWGGNPNFPDDRVRSPGLEPFLPLLKIPGVTFYSLQLGERRNEIAALGDRLGGNLVDLAGDIRDFADSAAIMAQMDLVITSCTSSAHLAGGLGRETWVALPFSPDWRWLLGRDDSPWYPTVRLFRQAATGTDWSQVMARLTQALAERAAPKPLPLPKPPEAKRLRVLFLCHAYPNYVPDLLLHGLRWDLGAELVDYPRKDCLYQGILGLGICPEGQKFPLDLMPPDGEVDRSDIERKVETGYFDMILADIRAVREHLGLLNRATCPLGLIDGEDQPARVAVGKYAIFRRETDGSDLSIPLPMGFPEQALRWIAGYDDQPKKYSVGFLGSRSVNLPDRNRVIDSLAGIYPDGLIMGTAIPNQTQTVPQGRLDRDDYYRTLQQCRVLLTLPGAGFDTFRYWEHAACAAVHVAQRMPLFIPDDFIEGQGILRFSDMEQLHRAVDAALADEGRAQEMAAASRAHLLAHHTTVKRAAYVIDRMRRAFHM